MAYGTTIGDAALAAGFPLVAPTDDAQMGYEHHNLTRDLVAGSRDLITALRSDLTAVQAPSRARLVFIFDDGLDGHYSTALPLFESFGGRCSLAIVSDEIGNPVGNRTTDAQIEDAHRRGHGIIAHSKTHAKMTDLTAAARAVEWDTPLQILTALTAGKPLDWVYPSSANTETTDAEGYLRYRRMFTGVQGPYSIPTTQRMPHVMGRFPYTADSHAEFMGVLQDALTSNKTVVAYTHGFQAGILAGITEILTFCLENGIDPVAVDALEDPNLVKNGGFEDGLDGWTVAASGVSGTHTAAAVTGGAFPGFNGEYVLALSTDTVGHNVYVDSDPIYVQGRGFPQRFVTASAHMRTSTPIAGENGVYIGLVEYDSAGNILAVTRDYVNATTFTRGAVSVNLNGATTMVKVRVGLAAYAGTGVIDHVHFAPYDEGALG